MGSTALFPKLNGAERILRTGSLTVAYQNPAVRAELENDPYFKQNTAIELFDATQGLDENSGNRTYDVVLISGLSNIAGAPIGSLLKKDGRICVLEAETLADETLDLLRKSHMEATLIHRIAEIQSQRLSLVIGKNSGVHINGTTTETVDKHVTLLQMPSPSPFAKAVATDLTMSLERSGYITIPFTWGSDTSQISGKSCISLVELENPLLRDLTEKDFYNLKQLVLETAGILWVVGFDDPSAGMIDGLARTVRNEIPGMSFRTIHTGGKCSPSTTVLGDLIGKVFGSKTEDDEFLVKDNVLHVSRIEEDMSLNEEINDLLPGAPERISTMPLGNTRYPTKLCIRNPGMLDSLCLEPDDLPGTVLEDDFIEIQVKATALK